MYLQSNVKSIFFYGVLIRIDWSGVETRDSNHRSSYEIKLKIFTKLTNVCYQSRVLNLLTINILNCKKKLITRSQ